MKKYILPLILILLLTFTLGGYSAWLPGWDYRIEISIGDYAGDIGAPVTWFPATVFLTGSQAEEVFAELTTDAEYLKTAVTKADGTTEMYAEFKLFDVSETKGIFRTSKSDWTINANTSIFLYYDKDHADNTDWIGVAGSIPAEKVWNDEYRLRYDMADAIDIGNAATNRSASTGTDYTFVNKGNPATTSGKISKVQVYFLSSATDVKIFICSADGNDLTSKDIEVIGNVGTGIQTLDVDLDVEVGDYIGIYWNTGAFYFDGTGGEGVWEKSGDNSAADGETFVLQSTRVASVGSVNFVSDSTHYDNDGTKKAANEPIEATGKVGQGQSFDGSDDYITFPEISLTDFTISAIIYPVSGARGEQQVIIGGLSNENWIRLQIFPTADEVQIRIDSLLTFAINLSENFTLDNWQHFVITRSGNDFKLFRNGSQIGTTTVARGSLIIRYIGRKTTDDYFYKGKQDEFDISNTVRSDAWIKGTYNSLWDTLFTYGSEETELVAAMTWNGIVITKWNGVTITIPINTQ